MAARDLLDDAFLGNCDRRFDRPVNDSFDRDDSLVSLDQNIHNRRSCTFSIQSLLNDSASMKIKINFQCIITFVIREGAIGCYVCGGIFAKGRESCHALGNQLSLAVAEGSLGPHWRSWPHKRCNPFSVHRAPGRGEPPLGEIVKNRCHKCPLSLI